MNTLRVLILISILCTVSCTNVTDPKTISHKSFLSKITKKKDDKAVTAKLNKVEPKKEKLVISQPLVNIKNVAAKNGHWQWPVKLQNIKMQPQKNGLDIFGQSDSEVFAARSGEVVYSGSALRGYGNLIIIKHDNNYISAYGHNEKIFVKEGDKIQLGQKIATMGNSGTDQVKLHFEIRHNGKPIDPSTILTP